MNAFYWLQNRYSNEWTIGKVDIYETILGWELFGLMPLVEDAELRSDYIVGEKLTSPCS